MSINRTLTRMAVVSALNNFLEEPWPTVAGPNIFDSKIEPVEDMGTDRAFPTCVVYTDYDKDHWNKGSKVHRDRLLTVTLELLVVQAESVEQTAGQPPVYQLDCPVTDSEIETTLDIFEVQIFRALQAKNAAGEVFGYLASSYENVISRRGASVEGGQRLAARQLTLELKANREVTSGTIPPLVEAFLTRLETQDDYKHRVDEIRAMMTWADGLSLNDRLAQSMGWNSDLAARLGKPTGPSVLLPPNLTYNYPAGGPLT